MPLHFLIGIVAVFILLMAGLFLDRRNEKEEAASSVVYSATPVEEVERRETSIPEGTGEEEYATAAGRPEEAEGKTDAEVIEHADQDAVCRKIGEIIKSTGRYDGVYEQAMFDDLHYAWNITDLSFDAGRDERYRNLYKYAMGITVADDFDEVYGDGSTLERKEGDQAWCAAYVEMKDDGTAVIHRITVDTDVLMDDNYVPRDAM